MFKNGRPNMRQYCKACKEPFEDMDSASFVSIEDERMKKVHKPLVVFFLYSGDNAISDKICLDCFDKFKGISDFYAKCKNSQNEYTPCFRESTPRKQSLDNSTQRILSTETPDVSSNEEPSRKTSIEIISSEDQSKRIQSSTMDSSTLNSSSTMHSVPIQSSPICEFTQSNRPREKRKHILHHDLGIKLPKPVLNERGCFDPEDFSYTLLKDEFDKSQMTLQEIESLQFLGTCKRNRYPPISSVVDEWQSKHKHSMVSACPFCPSLISRRQISSHHFY